MRSRWYSRKAMSVLISFTARTRLDSRTKRTTCREMPRGRAARNSSGHSSRGVSHGRSSRAGSGSCRGDLESHATIVADAGRAAPSGCRPSTKRTVAVLTAGVSVAEALAAVSVEHVHVPGLGAR